MEVGSSNSSPHLVTCFVENQPEKGLFLKKIQTFDNPLVKCNVQCVVGQLLTEEND